MKRWLGRARLGLTALSSEPLQRSTEIEEDDNDEAWLGLRRLRILGNALLGH